MILFSALFLSLPTLAQKAYTVTKDDQNGSLIYKGPITISDLQAEPSFTWMSGAANYKPDPSIVSSLRQSLPGYSIVAVMGTWCDDSQLLIPRLAKVLQDASYPMSKFTLWGVDRAKESGNAATSGYSAKKVPTIILFRDGIEVGRIVVAANKSIEADLAQIIQKQG